MRAHSKLKPGQPGTVKMVKQFGDHLVCVRFAWRKRRLKTSWIATTLVSVLNLPLVANATETNRSSETATPTNAVVSANSTNTLTITTTKGLTYKNCKLQRVEPDGVTFFHSAGIAKIPFTELPPEYATKYGYDPQNAARFSRDMVQQRTEFEKTQTQTSKKRSNDELNNNQMVYISVSCPSCRGLGYRKGLRRSDGTYLRINCMTCNNTGNIRQQVARPPDPWANSFGTPTIPITGGYMEEARKKEEQARQKKETEEKAAVARLEVIARLEAALNIPDKYAAESALIQLREPDDRLTSILRARAAALPWPKNDLIVNLGADVKLTMCWIPPGTFVMGSPKSEPNRLSCETQHQVTLTKGFWLGMTEVTQAQWTQVMDSNPSHNKHKDRSVEQVSWDDCQEFLRKINTLIPDGGFRLPTEAEWEYACRAGLTSPFGGFFKVDIDNNTTTYQENRFSPNAWKLRNMLGNVSEWCSDDFNDFSSDRVTDPMISGSSAHRVIRGGCWFSSIARFRFAYRSRNSPGARDNGLGLRLARTTP
jgi:formylglycine-generating enzyme required for sulfatase activity